MTLDYSVLRNACTHCVDPNFWHNRKTHYGNVDAIEHGVLRYPTLEQYISSLTIDTAMEIMVHLYARKICERMEHACMLNFRLKKHGETEEFSVELLSTERQTVYNNGNVIVLVGKYTYKVVPIRVIGRPGPDTLVICEVATNAQSVPPAPWVDLPADVPGGHGVLRSIIIPYKWSSALPGYIPNETDMYVAPGGALSRIYALRNIVNRLDEVIKTLEDMLSNYES